jgi:signal peptidase I
MTPKETAPEAAAIPAWLKIWQSHKENLLTLAIALVLALLIRVCVAESRYIPSTSMAPTLLPGDRLMVEKVSYRFHPPRPGEIVVFYPPPALQAIGYDPSQAFIKRVIATPGQVVEVHQGQVYVDDLPLSESYITELPDYELSPIRVPEQMLFVMGDNRNNSNDSHIWGFLPQANVIGRANLRFWPLSTFTMIRNPLTTTLGSSLPYH